MFSNQIDECFRMTFEAFFLKNNILWNTNAFAGSNNGLFSFIFTDYTECDGENDVDIIFLTLPDFSVNADKINKTNKYGLSLKNVADFENITINTKVRNSEDIEPLMCKFLELLQHQFHKYFMFDSFTSYADKMLETGRKFLDFVNIRPVVSGKFFQRFSDIDFVNLCYYYMVENGIEKCRDFTLELIGGYRMLLYDKMKNGNISELSHILSECDRKCFDRMFINYSKITQFAEALIERNESYFSFLDKSFGKNLEKGRTYINAILAE